MSNNKQQSYGQQGFTLVELMISLLIFMVIMLGLAAGLIQTMRVNRGNVVRDEALRLATDELNQLKSERFTLSGTSAALNLKVFTDPNNPVENVPVSIRKGIVTFARKTQITDLGASATALRRIDVAVGWNDPGNVGTAVLAPTGKNRQMSLSTIIVRSD